MTKTKISIFLLLISLGIQLSSSAPYISNTYENTLVAKLIGYRLPTNTAPRRYQIAISPNMEDEKFSFDGEGYILFEVLTPTATVVFHASKFLEIDKTITRLVFHNNTMDIPIGQKWNPHLEFYSIRFRNTLVIGNYTLIMSWRGYQVTNQYGDDQDDGFFRAVDKRRYENETYVAATHFEATSARSAFPCWDEPALKAQFDIAIRHHTNYTALSNMPVDRVEHGPNGEAWTFFQTTPPMSSYLVAFAVIPYDYHTDDDLNVTTWVPEEKLREARVSFEISRLIPAAMKRYTGIPYDLPKMDHVILPKYGSEAIENWGLILYSDNAIFNPDTMGPKKLMYAMYLTAHEIIHQWFGNLVTPAWWNDLWLSEALAEYFAYKMLDDVIHKWNAKEVHASVNMNGDAFHADRRRPHHPIRWMPETKKEIDEMFSSVTYDKGGCIVRMLEHIMTEKTFQYGIRKYLEKHRYSSVTSDDLWQSLQEAFNEKHVSTYLNIKELMDPWLDQTGYPLINVTRDYRTGLVTIIQSDMMDEKSGNLWMIPINYATSQKPSFEYTEPTHWMMRNNGSLTIYGIDRDDWIIVNIQQTGFYRVNYDWENWRRLIAFLNTDNFHQIHVINRAQILYDLAVFAHKDQRYWELLFDATTYLHRETHFLPWNSLIEELNQYTLMLINTPSFDMFKRFMVYLMDSIINHVGFDDKLEDDFLTRAGRHELMWPACFYEHERCVAVAPIKLRERLSGGEKKELNPNSRGWIYCAALKHGDERLWDRVMEIHSANPVEQEAYKYLGCMKNHALITKYLNMAMMDNATMLVDDLDHGLKSIIMGPAENLDFALNLWIKNIDKYTKHFVKRGHGREVLMINEMFSGMIKTVTQFEKFTAFLRKQTEDGVLDSEMSNELTEMARETMRVGEKASAVFNSFLQKKPHLLNILHNMHNPRYNYI